MALQGFDRGAGATATAGENTLVATPSAAIAAGSMAVLCSAYDNSATGGADPYVSIADSQGNTWTSRVNVLRDPSIVGAGLALRIFTSTLTTGLGTGDTITISFSDNTTARAWGLHEVTPSAGKTPGFAEGAGTSAVGASPQITTGTILSGNILIAAMGAEHNSAITPDSDTTNGSWSTHQTAGAGSGTVGMEISSQRKQVTGTSGQSYDCTITSTDWCTAWIEVEEIDLPSPLDNLEAYFPCDEASGAILDDRQGANDLAATGAPPSVAGKLGTARGFTAATPQYFSIADNVSLSSGAAVAMTVGAWVRLTTKASAQTILSKWRTSDSQREYLLYYDNAADRYRFLFSPNGTGSTMVTADNFGAVTVGEWHRVIAWHDPVADLIGIAVDGGAANTAAHSTGGFDGAAPFRVGAIGDTDLFLDGELDEIFVAKRVWTAGDRADDYNGGAGRALFPSAVATAAGTSTVTGVSEASASVASAAGVATVSGVGAAIVSAVADSQGTSTLAGVGGSTAAAVSSSAGSSTVSGVGSATASAAGQSAGTATLTAQGASTARAVASAQGTSTVVGVSDMPAGESVFTIAGSSTLQGTGAANAVAVAVIAGTSTATAVGSEGRRAVAQSAGQATAAAVGESMAVGVGTAAGTSTFSGIGSSLASAIAVAVGTSTVQGFSATPLLGPGRVLSSYLYQAGARSAHVWQAGAVSAHLHG